MLLGSKTFSKEDQLLFSTLSGDKNPIHIDEVFARKTSFGKVVVHGINALLTALELHVENSGSLFENLAVKFLKPIYLDEQIDFFFNSSKNSIEILSCDIVLARILFFGKKHIRDKCDDFIQSQSDLEITDFNFDAPNIPQKINLVSKVRCELVEKCFPLLCSVIDKSRAGQIACLSSVVGMQIPGLYSLFVSADIRIIDTADHSNIINVTKIDSRFGIVDLLAVSKNVTTKIRAIIRPRPKEGVKISTLVEKLDSNYRCKKNILIIGGSRGIGAACVKILALAGHNLTVTYKNGYEEALALHNELRSYGCKTKFVQFDLYESSLEPLFDNNPTLVFYFATPAIFVKRSPNFDQKLYRKFDFYYHKFLNRLLGVSLHNGVAALFNPSTVAIDTDSKDMPEYVRAKKNGEEAAAYYTDNTPLKVFSPRIPRTLTDQTLTNLSVTAIDPHDVMLQLIPQFFEFISKFYPSFTADL